MAYIYQIINDINDKIYIGKTERSIEERWNEHCRACNYTHYEKRPLYSAMKKYGIEHFHISLLEETDNPEERETYWIEQKQSFKHGYNATIGGDGKKYIDYDLVIASYKETQNVAETARRLNIDRSHASTILRTCNIDILSTGEVNQKRVGKVINQYTLQGEYIQSFPSAKSAADALGKTTATSKGATSHITDVCRGKRKTAYGYIWKFSN